jgi:predicted DNA-binding transcriptional regulator YafY
MRADRLLAELTMLQARGRMTAAQLAVELEITERTVYRDMYALQVAGVPLIAERGPDGGYSLYGDWRADLTGLTTAEMESLLVASASSPAARTGSRAATAAAKLAALLPPEAARELSQLRRRIHVVLEADEGVAPVGDTAASLVAALRGGRSVDLVLRRARTRRIERRAQPIGLVIAGRDWYLAWHGGDGRPRLDALDDIDMVSITAEPAIDSGSVDLDQLWRGWRAMQRELSGRFEVRLRMDSRLVDVWRDRHPTVSVEEGDGDVGVVAAFGSIIEARMAVLPWGGAIEVLAPRSLRLSVADFARQTAALYDDE